MRFYSFTNMYLSSLQVGLQSGHVLSEMFLNFPDAADLKTWATEHKTMILLNAGYSATLHEIYASLCNEENPYPFAKFHESEEALDGALTCVGIVVPDVIYETAAEVRTSRGNYGRNKVDDFNNYGEWISEGTIPISYKFTRFQVWLINEMNKYGLAK